MALAEAMEEDGGAPGVEETTEGEETDEEEVGGGAWIEWEVDGGAGRAGTGGGRFGISPEGGDGCLPLSLSRSGLPRCCTLRLDWLPDGFCERSGLDDEEESCLGFRGPPPKLWQWW